jgi:hypothetical protein
MPGADATGRAVGDGRGRCAVSETEGFLACEAIAGFVGAESSPRDEMQHGLKALKV